MTFSAFTPGSIRTKRSKVIMKLSTKSRYGLRVLLQIAIDSEKKRIVTGRELARRQEISEPYLEQIMIPLKNSGTISTVRGCRGGYRLKKPPSEITVLSVIEIFEGDLHLVRCRDSHSPCPRHEYCITSKIWMELTESIREKADSINLELLMNMAKEQKHPEFSI